MSLNTPNNTNPTSGLEQKPPVPQRGQPMLSVMIDNKADDPIPRSRSNPTFDTSRRFPTSTKSLKSGGLSRTGGILPDVHQAWGTPHWCDDVSPGLGNAHQAWGIH
ncbi:hypothetical protein M378DRAFT_913528 [Amanita muscaria Koide BX008]|uniref:Uncharacterized protein n=1 Tax=Amanita muscaria (strain Koide BX008) TaxID=946122 RepID=A0A0C2WWF8_AMAMK|nr:hypothetical protein M378DRAFT_913528 [Amanita muscaria Koide BX008]